MTRLLIAALCVASGRAWATMQYELNCVSGEVVCTQPDCTTIIFKDHTKSDAPLVVDGILQATLRGAAKLLSDGAFKFTETFTDKVTSCHIDVRPYAKISNGASVHVSMNGASCGYKIPQKGLFGKPVYFASLKADGESCTITK